MPSLECTRAEPADLEANAADAFTNGERLRALAHDFNNVLTVVRLSAEMIEHHAPDEGPIAESVRELFEIVASSSALVRRLSEGCTSQAVC